MLISPNGNQELQCFRDQKHMSDFDVTNIQEHLTFCDLNQRPFLVPFHKNVYFWELSRLFRSLVLRASNPSKMEEWIYDPLPSHYETIFGRCQILEVLPFSLGQFFWYKISQWLKYLRREFVWLLLQLEAKWFPKSNITLVLAAKKQLRHKLVLFVPHMNDSSICSREAWSCLSDTFSCSNALYIYI